MVETAAATQQFVAERVWNRSAPCEITRFARTVGCGCVPQRLRQAPKVESRSNWCGGKTTLVNTPPIHRVCAAQRLYCFGATSEPPSTFVATVVVWL